MRNLSILALIVLSLSASPVQGQEEPREIAGWLIVEDHDPMTDERVTSVAREADDGSSMLIFRCNSDGFDLIVGTGFTPSDFEVRYRIGDAEPTAWVGNWGRSTNSRAVFARSSDRDEIFQSLPTVDRIVIQVRSRSGTDTATFTGLDPRETEEALGILHCRHSGASNDRP